ncbi:MAG TPA: RNA polymerase sigma-54 factor, partial [Saprospiraceae bacterium]|nr:RNA polymerase sigma-54 factor [Saprospiraceae bacterium]
MIKQTLSQKMLQKLSPQQIQLMKLFQIPTANLEERIQEELEINPALEEGGESADVFDIESDEWGSHKEEDSEKSNNDEDFELGDYLNEYLDDDPSLYKMKG